VDQPKDIIQYLRVVRILLEADELIVDGVQALVGLGQEFAKKIIHDFWPSKPRREFFAPFRGQASFNAKHLNIG
jgi:hypothetical protein